MMPPSVTAPLFTSAELAKRTLQRRGVEAALWGMPLVSVDAMRQAFFRDAGAAYGDILYLSRPADWRFRTTTPNASSLYVYFNFNLKDGPVVLEVPSCDDALLFGTIIDAWETPLADVGLHGDDAGGGAKYVITRDEAREIPGGCIPVWSNTVNGYARLRVLPATPLPDDVQTAVAVMKKVRLYPLSAAANPPSQRHIDIAGKLFDGVTRFDDTFYDSLARMVNEEPVPRDSVVMAHLRSLGIEKGKPFKPDEATRRALRSAVAEVHAILMDRATSGRPYWPGSQWVSPIGAAAKAGATDEPVERPDIESRAMAWLLAYAAPKSAIESRCHVAAFRDASGMTLQGGESYRLAIPPNVPVSHHWSVTVYDLATAAFIADAPRPGIDSYDRKLKKNDDGSVDIHFGPTAPTGRDTNWIYTAPRKPWFSFFRFHGADRAVSERTWILPNIERAR